QTSKHHGWRHGARMNDALTDGGCDLDPETERRDEIEERCPRDRLTRRQHACRDHGCDRVGGVVKAVHEIEQQCHDDQKDDQTHPAPRAIPAAGWAQVYSSATPSRTLATSSHRSMASSMSSKMSFHLMIATGSLLLLNKRANAVRTSVSPSFS